MKKVSSRPAAKLNAVFCILASCAACQQSGEQQQPVPEPARDCYGAWQFARGELMTDPEIIVPDTWCLHLPQSFTVELRRGPTFDATGVPFKPTDVLFGARKCEFQFEGPTPGVPEDFTLIAEVPDDSKAFSGLLVCTAWKKSEHGGRAGFGVKYPLSGARQ